MPSRIRLPAVILVGACLLWPDRAHAYIDAHSGSILLQMAIAGFLGAAFALRSHLGRLVSWINRKGPEQPPKP